MKRGRSCAKGHAFERLICRTLSLWWTDGERDDVFSRTSSSGAQATQRSKVGKKTFGQVGDIQAADPLGQPLLNLFVLECKDGYAGDSFSDIFDSLPRHNPKYLQFIHQAQHEAKEAGKPSWMLIARRRGRQIMIFFPRDMKRISPLFAMTHRSPYARLYLEGEVLIITSLKRFLKVVTPEQIKNMLHSLKYDER
jgi:hypothetical protein